MSTLYIVATPIGNLGDFSKRAEETLRAASVILCEDTRVTQKLLARYGITNRLMSYHAQSSEKRMIEILDLLKSGADLALVSDAGTPGINDPGGKLVERVVRVFGDVVRVVPIPGPSAVATALSISGFPAERFTYVGFPPQKKGREKFFRELAARGETVVFLESPHRIMKALATLSLVAPQRELMIGRELTKLYETVYRGTATEVTEALKRDKILGEFVVVVRRM